LIHLKDEAEKIRDQYSENIYWPLINAVLVTVYSSIAKKKLEAYYDNEKSLKDGIDKLEAEKHECKGKLSVLREVRGRISVSLSKNETWLQRTIKDVKEAVGVNKQDSAQVGGVEGEERTPINEEEFESQKQQIYDDSYLVIEKMKSLENDHETNFQDFLKSLSRILINNRTINN